MHMMMFLTGMLLAGAAQAASFDCARAQSPVEKLICAEPALSKLDDELATAYANRLKDNKSTDALRQEQRQWLKERNGCVAADCLKASYRDRIRGLSSTPGLVAVEYPEGEWFTCIPEMVGRRSPFSLLSIKREGENFVVGNEWGENYSFSGRATMVGTELLVLGCSFFRGDPMDNCDVNNPPITSTMKPPSSRTRPINLDKALRLSEPISTNTATEWQRLADRCEEIIEALENK